MPVPIPISLPVTFKLHGTPFVSLDACRYVDDGEEMGGGGSAGRTCDPEVTAAIEFTEEPNSSWNFGGEDMLW